MAEQPVSFATLQSRVVARLNLSPALTRTTATYASSGAVTVTLADSSNIGVGSVIENQTSGEQMLVATVPDSTSVTINAEGRGYRGSTAAAGLNGDIITIDPKFSVQDRKTAINVAYNDWFSFHCPRIAWDTTTAGYFDADHDLYAAPAEALSVDEVGYWYDSTKRSLTALEHSSLQIYPSVLLSTGKGFSLPVIGPEPRIVTDAGITASAATLTSATAAFSSGDVGQTVAIVGAGAAGATLVTYISAVTNSTTATVNTSASTTVSGATATIGPAIWQRNRLRWTQLETGDSIASDFPTEGIDLIVDGAVLYLLGYKSLPKYNPTDAAAFRELGTSNPTNLSMTELRIWSSMWAHRVREIASTYNTLSGSWPQVTFIP